MSGRIVTGNHDVGFMIASHVPMIYNPAADIVIHHERGDSVAGGVIYNNFTGESVVVSVVGLQPGWCTRRFLQVSFDYPFNQLGVKRIFAQIAEHNNASLSFTAKNGFKAVGYIPGVYRGNVAAVICCLERENCRFLPREPLERSDHGRQE